MGTHPIFESDFDCLTDIKNMDRLEGVESTEDRRPEEDIIWTPIGMFSKRAEERRASLATLDNSYILKTRKVKQEEEELIWTPFGMYPKAKAVQQRRASVAVMNNSKPILDFRKNSLPDTNILNNVATISEKFSDDLTINES